MSTIPSLVGDFSYETAIRSLNFGEVTLDIECLADFERTVDQVCEYFIRVGINEFSPEICPYFASIWPSAQALCRHISEHYNVGLLSKLGKLRILELGCGLAIPSLFLGALGYRVVASDCHPEVPHFLQRNLRHNCDRLNPENVSYMSWNWRQTAPVQLEPHSFDIVIGSDLLYDNGAAESLLAAAVTALAPTGCFLVADPGRAYWQHFLNIAEPEFAVSSITRLSPVKEVSTDLVHVYLGVKR